MSRISFRICLGFLLLILLDSCSVWHTLVPKRKNNYINYTALFADDNAELRKVQNEQQIRMDGKVRIVTINKITMDTIVEWVDPIEITGGKKLVFSTKEKPTSTLDTVGIILNTPEKILVPHKAIIFVPANAEPNYLLRNDTLFVQTNEAQMQKALIAMMAKTEEPKPIVAKEKTNGRQLRKQKKELQKNAKPANNASKIITTDINPETIDNDTVQYNLPSAELLANNALIVGDADFDLDDKAELIQDEQILLKYLELQQKQWNTLKCKAKVKLKTPSDNKFFYVNFRLKKNTNTWASINLPVVGELARLSATADSLLVLDKWKDKFYGYSINSLEQLINLPIPYSALQSYIIGDVVSINAKQLIGKKSTKGMAIKVIAAGMSCIYTFNTDSTLKTMVVIGNANGKSYSIRHQLSNYETSANGLFSTKRILNILENGKETFVQLDITKYEFEAELDFPFSVPAHFKDGTKVVK